MKKSFLYIALFGMLFSSSACSNSGANTNPDPEPEPETVYCSVSFLSVNGITFEGENKVEKGKDYTFNVIYSESPQYDFSNLTIYANDIAISSDSTTYTIQNVQEDLAITGKGITIRDAVRVYFLSNDFVEFQGESTAYKGASYSFTMTLADPQYYYYDLMRVLVNDVEITEVDGKYTVSEVTSILTIGVDNVYFNDYSVNFINNGLFNFIGLSTAETGKKYVFDIESKTNAIDRDSIKVTVNGKIVERGENGFVTDLVYSDLEIRVVDYIVNDPNEDDDENKGDNFIPDFD